MNFFHGFNRHELKFLSGLGAALGLRQMALILISPYISIYGSQLSGHTPALVGLFIGGAAIISLVGVPFLYQISSISIMFWVCGGLTTLSMLYILFFLSRDKSKTKRKSSIRELLHAAKNKNLLAISFAGFAIEFVVIATLYMAPIILKENLDPGNFWRVFVPGIILGLIALRISSSLVKKKSFLWCCYHLIFVGHTE